MIRVARPAGFLLVAVVAALGLTGCTPNVTAGALSWMAGQSELTRAELVVDRTTLYGTSGVIRGELRPDLAPDRFDALVQRAVDYVSEHDGVEFRLGYDDVDFLIQDADATAAGRQLWDGLLGLDGLESALASDGDVHVRVLRPEARDAVEELRDWPAAVEVEAFRTAEAEEADRRNDDYGPRQNRDGAVSLIRASTCEPSDDEWERAVRATEARVESGDVDLCGAGILEYVPESDLVAVALEWAAVQDASADPAPEFTVTEEGLNGRIIRVTPGDPALFPVVAGFETAGAPDVFYELAADATLTLSGDVPASELVAVLSSSPVADRLASISVSGVWPGPIGGESVIVRGTVDRLPELVAEVESLFPLDPSFYTITADPESLRVDLYSPPGSDPDMATAALALRSSPLWQNRFTVVGYQQAEIHIEDGVASIPADYQVKDLLQVFVDAWNAG